MRVAVAFIVLGLAFSGCFPQFGRRDQPPQWSRHADACANLFLYQPHGQERVALEAGMDWVCDTFQNDARFRERVGNTNGWLVTAAPTAECRTGAEVVASVLDAHYTEIHLLVNALAPSTRGQTEVDSYTRPGPPPVTSCRSTITLGAPWIEQWPRSDASRDAILNTLAHEMAHAAPDGLACASPYEDGDHDACTERRLVSYHLGDMLECHRAHRDDDDAFATCLRVRRPVADEAACAGQLEQACRASP